MDHAQRLVTFPRRIDQNAKGDQVINLVVEKILAFHLLVDTKKVFRPASDFGLDSLGLKLSFDDGNHFIDVLFAIALLLGDVALQLIIDLRMQDT